MRVPWPGSSSRICSERAAIVPSHAGSLGLTDPAGRLQEPLCRDGFTNLSYLLFGRRLSILHGRMSIEDIRPDHGRGIFTFPHLGINCRVSWDHLTLCHLMNPNTSAQGTPSKSHVSCFPLYPHPALTSLLTSCNPPFYFYVCMCTYVC